MYRQTDGLMDNGQEEVSVSVAIANLESRGERESRRGSQTQCLGECCPLCRFWGLVRAEGTLGVGISRYPVLESLRQTGEPRDKQSWKFTAVPA